MDETGPKGQPFSQGLAFYILGQAMAEITTTRLRFVSAKDPKDLGLFLDQLAFRVEIKGQPVWNGSRYILFFVIPDNVAEFSSVEL